jgi:hypothetical protein
MNDLYAKTVDANAGRPLRYTFRQKSTDEFYVHVLPYSPSGHHPDDDDLPVLQVDENDPEADDLPVLVPMEDGWTNIGAPARGNNEL